MAFFSSAIKLMTAGTLCIALAACKTPEEEAREFYEDALSLIEQGDTDRAIVQLRNASQTDPALVEARSALGAIFLERGDFARAYRQYLRVAEQIPDDVESRFVLAEIAFDVQNWEVRNSPAGCAALVVTRCGGIKLLGGYGILSSQILATRISLAGYQYKYIKIEAIFHFIDGWAG